MAEPDLGDTVPPVVLQEPLRKRPVTDWRESFTLRPEEAGVPGLHPGWAGVLSSAETALWQGRPTPDPRLRAAKGIGGRIFLVGAILFVALNTGMATAGILPFAALAVFGYLALRKTITGKIGPSNRIYLLTDRAAYLARSDEGVLAEVVSYPITPSLRLGLGPRSVSFATRRDAKGEVEAEGFLDIDDARQVHDLIRDLQKGKA